MLCDISGSMDRYARMLLHFLHAITNDRHRVHVLTVRHAAHQHHAPLEASRRRRRARARGGAVADWAGGTRIGASLAEFNRRWSRRLLGQNAVVLLISDGLDADAGAGLEFADGAPRQILPAAGLAQSAAALFGASRRGPRASARCCRYVDDFLPVHNLQSLTDVAKALAARPQRGSIKFAFAA